ncbi:RRP45 [[Candida] subhashii]|uniref:RRP45 n=1 Tax=[Candida] subhashii TaxID=561895 RepID=A0A8J5QFG4_9ASCO|nr:RRP45 [[Candida] subhashii]KAG7661104.1 RRP45 [[Candida] subhashii]
MSRKIEISTNQTSYIHHTLLSGLRLTNRPHDSIRDIEINLSTTEYGYVEINWGLTKLAVRVSAKIVQPYEDRPFEGIFTINNEINPLISGGAGGGSASSSARNDEIMVNRIIEKAIRRSNSLDLESLCIIAGEKVWEIMVDLNFLNYDGNLIDVGCFGVMLALHHFKKPDVSIMNGGERVIVHSVDERMPVSLSILHIPICLTWSFYNVHQDKESNIKGGDDDEAGEVCLLDADLLEELNRDGSLVITLNKNRELIQLSKNGGIAINAEQLLELSFKSMKIVDELSELIKSKIKEHEELRYKLENFKLLEASADR